MKTKRFKTLAIFLSVTILFSCVGAVAYTAAQNENGEPQTVAVETAAAAADQTDLQARNEKEETVYIIAGADGAVQKVIASNWVKNTRADIQVRDITELHNVEVVKGDETYGMEGENQIVWDAQGNDIYYQGNIQKQLPVDILVSYKLDGKSISPGELAGKSGKVIIRFDYINNQYRTVSIGGKEEKIHVPFVLLTGMALDNDAFRKVEVSSGKLINDGDRTLVAGLAFPGLSENLNVSREDLDLPDYVEISADVTDFALSTTITVATNEVFSDLDTGKIDSLDDLSDSLRKLDDAMSKLLDGSSDLYDGLTQLLDKSGELVSGIEQLTVGSKALSQGADNLGGGAAQLQAGVQQLAGGLDALTANSAELNSGAKQIFQALLSTANQQLKLAGLNVDTLTIDNYSAVLGKVISSLDEGQVRKFAYNTAKANVEEAVNAQRPQVTAAVTEAVRKQVTEQVLGAANLGMTTDQYAASVAAGNVPQPVQQQVSDEVTAQMSSDAVQAIIQEKTDAQIQQLVQQNMESDEVQAKINAAATQAQSGSGSMVALKTQLDSFNQFYQGLAAYTAGVDEAAKGASMLKGGADGLKGGADALKDGANELYEGLNRLNQGSNALVEGVEQLRKGSMQLSNGLKEFNEKGIQKLIDAVGEDLDGFVARLHATCDVSKEYTSFSGISDDMDGRVKFVYRTESIN